MALAAALALLAAPAPAPAWHASQASWDTAFPPAGTYVCTNCHTLSTVEGEVGTSYIASSSRTLPLIKAYNSGAVPTNLGCTYCHNTPGNAKMKDALSHFGGKASKHPVGMNWVSGADTNREYLSSASPDVTATTDMDCLDCHDAALINAGNPTAPYVSHTTIPASNPYMLRSVTAADQYDNFCRGCHGAAAPIFKGQNVRLTSHADALGAATIQENDGTLLRTSSGTNQCNKCHDSHYSTKVKLFNDGHEGDTAIVSTDCTTVCHYSGDVNNGYVNHGHGKALSTYKYKGVSIDYAAGNFISMGMACTSCHASIDTSDTSATRKPHVEPGTGGTIQQNYMKKFNLDLAVQTFDTGSIFGNPASGVCYSCHASYEPHVSTAAGSYGTAYVIGCLDCHDEHAEGSGVGSNYFMIPETAKKAGTYITPPVGKGGTEVVIYDQPRRIPATGATNMGAMDFYSTGAVVTGVCDVAECHPSYTPLSSFAANHSGDAATIVAGSDCEGCHAHVGDDAGGWRATESCSACHSYPGAAIADADHLLSGVHNRHVDPAGSGGLAYPCETCHFGYTHNQSGYTNDSNNWTDATVAPANINVRFNTSAGQLNAGLTNLTYNALEADSAAAGGVATNHNGACGGLLCHGNATPKQSDWTGLDETPNWGLTDPAPLACNTCHNNPPATPAANDAHGAHVTTAGYVCGDCHTAETATTHVNGSINLVGTLTYSGGRVVGDFNYGTCTTGSCHNAATNIAWNAVQGNCNQCHQVLSATPEDNWVGNDRVASKVVQAEWTGYGHGKAAAALACTDCHSMAVPHDYSPALNGAGNNPYRLQASFTCSNTTAACHAAGTSGPVTGLDISTITNHDKALMGTDGKRTWPWTPQCANCHDPHGDGTNIAMIGNEIYESAPLNLLAAPAGLVVQNTALVFTSGGTPAAGHGVGVYALAASPWSNICQECHIATGTGMLSYLDNSNTSAGGHPGAVGGDPGDCSNCHKHDAAFKPSGCNGCHGGSGYWPETAGNSRTIYPDRAGRHLLHMTVIGTRLGYGTVPSLYLPAQQKGVCLFCHNDSAAPTEAGGANHYPGGYTKLDAPANVGSFNVMWGSGYPDDANDSYTAATYSTDTWTGGSTCVALDCHNGTTTGAGFEWYGATATSCTMCHTVGGTGTVDPNTGMHDAASTTGILHDNSFVYNNVASPATCRTCHISGTSGPTTSGAHLNGANDSTPNALDGSDPRVFVAAGVGFTDAVTPTCRPVESGATAGCHFEQWRHTPGKTWTRLWHNNGGATDGTQCAGCHGNFTAWNGGVVPVHSNDFDGDGTAEVSKHGGTTAYDKCKTCHVYNTTAYLKQSAPVETNNLGWVPAGTSSHHGDGSIDMNGTLAYNQTNWQCGSNCHDTVGTHGLADSGWTVQTLAGPSIVCTACHDGSAQGAAGTINAASNHTSRSRSSTGTLTDATDCSDCHPGGTRGAMHKKNGLTNVIAIKNNSSVGIAYNDTVDTGIQGFVLGGDYTIGTTEADICWNCHSNNDDAGNPQGSEVSEWGTNTQTNGLAAAQNYNFGSLSTRSWFTATWSSANFRYKRGKLTDKPKTNVGAPATPGSTANGGSTHTANPDVLVGGVDTADLVRCSYCHDVHNGTNGNGTTPGKPFLRGTWKGNPYREDGAPRWDAGADLHSYTNRNNFGFVPRGNVLATEYGGYQIDQNNGTPASSWTYDTMGGLCQKCHGTALGTLNKFGTNGDGWTANLITAGRNSHLNVVAGATGQTPVNLFSEARRHTTAAPYPTGGGQTAGSYRSSAWMAAKHINTSGAAYTFRGTSGYRLMPTLTSARPYGPLGYNWGASVDTSTTQTGYHKFSCSKCHNPHASRLPRLLITNCLDTAANTWEDRYTGTGAGPYAPENTGVEYSQMTTAQNCHRRRDPAYGKTWTTYTGNTSGSNPATSVPDGWNTVSPW